jgi:hypothetical protein
MRRPFAGGCVPCRRRRAAAHGWGLAGSHDFHEQAGQNRETKQTRAGATATGLEPWAPSPSSVSYGREDHGYEYTLQASFTCGAAEDESLWQDLFRLSTSTIVSIRF